MRAGPRALRVWSSGAGARRLLQPAPTGPDPGHERELAGEAARLLGHRSVRRPPGRTPPNSIAPARLVGGRGRCGTCALWLVAGPVPVAHEPSHAGVHFAGRGTRVVSIAICAPLQRGRPFATTSILRPSVACRLSSRKATFVATRAPASRQMRATVRSSGGEDSDLCARKAVVTQAVEASFAATSLGSQRECEPEPAQQEDSELLLCFTRLFDQLGSSATKRTKTFRSRQPVE